MTGEYVKGFRAGMLAAFEGIVGSLKPTPPEAVSNDPNWPEYRVVLVYDILKDATYIGPVGTEPRVYLNSDQVAAITRCDMDQRHPK